MIFYSTGGGIYSTSSASSSRHVLEGPDGAFYTRKYKESSTKYKEHSSSSSSSTTIGNVNIPSLSSSTHEKNRGSTNQGGGSSGNSSYSGRTFYKGK